MNQREKEVFKQISSDFSKLKKRKRLDKQAEFKLTKDLTALIGIYGFDKAKVLEQQIEKMIAFGEKQLWAMQGPITTFEKLKKGQLKIRRLKGFRPKRPKKKK